MCARATADSAARSGTPPPPHGSTPSARIRRPPVRQTCSSPRACPSDGRASAPRRTSFLQFDLSCRKTLLFPKKQGFCPPCAARRGPLPFSNIESILQTGKLCKTVRLPPVGERRHPDLLPEQRGKIVLVRKAEMRRDLPHTAARCRAAAGRPSPDGGPADSGTASGRRPRGTRA